jgi:hypothetical protein
MNIKECSFQPKSGTCDFLLRLLMKWPVSKDELFQLLDIRCCDVNIQNSSGMTPLKAAIMNCDFEVVLRLIEFGAVITADILEFSRTKYPHKPEVFALLEKSELEVSPGLSLSSKQPAGKCMTL